jgi:hypothetical protein
MTTELDTAAFSALSLLDAKMDDLVDLPEWKTFPPGVYKVKPSVKIEKKPSKADAKKMDTVITISATLLAIKELADPASEKVEVGAETSCRYTWENEFGQGGLKKLLTPIYAMTENPSFKYNLDALHTADDVLLVMTTRVVKGKNGSPDAVYQQFTDLIVE